MDVILKVLEGAKVGAKVAVKKDEFLIGRSRKCHLCAGSTAVSRKHCAISRNGTKVTIKDLGSRNGTIVNDKKIGGEVELSSGDEIIVGPLRFLLTITQGINNEKKPHVKSVAEAVERTVTSGDSSVAEEDITQWLLEPEAPSKAATETQTISMDDTNAIQARMAAEEDSTIQESATSTADESGDEGSSKEKSKKKKEPGKLPVMSTEPATKDSCDAAAAALRNWNRRS